jgi:Mn2+/Fe2+ NRAMP family transporter
MVSQCLVSGYIITDLLKWEADLTSKKFKISEMVVTLFGLSAPLLGWNAFAIASYGSGFNLTFFPVVTVLFLIIGNKKDVMGELKLDKKYTVALVIAVLLSLMATANFWNNIL